MEFPLALSTATKTLCVDSVVEMATTVITRKIPHGLERQSYNPVVVKKYMK